READTSRHRGRVDHPDRACRNSVRTLSAYPNASAAYATMAMYAASIARATARGAPIRGASRRALQIARISHAECIAAPFVDTARPPCFARIAQWPHFVAGSGF